MDASGLEAVTLSPSRPRAAFDAKIPIIGLAVVSVAWLALVPLAFLIWQSFTTPGTPETAAQFTLSNYARVYGSAESFRLFANSVAFAAGA